MKKMKLAVAVAAFAASLGFTSCLDGSGVGGTGTMTWPLKVDYDLMTGKTIFTDWTDTEYVPTTEVMVSGDQSELAMVSFSYDYETFTSQGQRKDITILATPEYLPVGMMMGEDVPETGTVSVSSLSTNNTIVWGYNDYLILNPMLFVNKTTTNDTKNEELRKHKFTLYYDREAKAEGDILKLKLRYQIQDVATEEALKDYTQSYPYYYVYFDLREAIRAYEEVNESYPKRLEVEYETASLSTPTMDSSKKDLLTFSCELQPKPEDGI